MKLEEMKEQITQMHSDLQEIMRQLDNNDDTEIADALDEISPRLRKARRMISTAIINEQQGR